MEAAEVEFEHLVGAGKAGAAGIVGGVEADEALVAPGDLREEAVVEIIGRLDVGAIGRGALHHDLHRGRVEGLIDALSHVAVSLHEAVRLHKEVIRAAGIAQGAALHQPVGERVGLLGGLSPDLAQLAVVARGASRHFECLGAFVDGFGQLVEQHVGIGGHHVVV